eukprot:TRINITY_DN15081_c0_g1_i2.p1 TRINITY_DN15081_c0_g1~~TRINITY_DN15081_c0_g1_i2.p1  ORF type:complete len:141 (-),score=9.24 TRINITY_DN15081_c0_g1_i2:36-458(-)
MSHQESFINYLKYEKRYSHLTAIAYKKDLDQFEEFFVKTIGDFNVEGINDKVARMWVVELMDNGISSRTVNKKISALKSFYKYLLRFEVVKENNLVNVIVPKVCLLYTSDAADDMQCVDLCGRRIIKKKKYKNTLIIKLL